MDVLALPSGSPSRAFLTHKIPDLQAILGERYGVSLRSSSFHMQMSLNASFEMNQCRIRMRSQMERRKSVVQAKVATEAEVDGVLPPKSVGGGVAESVALLKTAAQTRKQSPLQICEAFRILDKAKVDPSDFLSIIGGTKSPGRTWLLIFTCSKNEYNSSGGGGKYVPITAVQNFDAKASRIDNGVYLGPLGALTFTGVLSWEKRKLTFFFHTLNLTLGSWGPFRFGIGSKDKQVNREDPFFIWYYADDEIIVAKGRGGGTAFWVRCTNVKKSPPIDV